MRVAAVVLSLLVPVLAEAGPAQSPVIGGTNVPAGKWPDVAAVFMKDKASGSIDQECTGTLIAPNVVLSAGHCVDEASYPIQYVLVGTTSLARATEGEQINVTKVVEYPMSQSTFDVSVLVLEKASKFEPRKIATGWASIDIKNGADVSIVGYGAIDKNAMAYVDDLKEATVKITDADCTTHSADGCVAAAQPAGELGAGGQGMPDTCPGDSGGPLYLPTDYGTFLAGVTSRGYDSNVYDCSEGGIYVRPDKLVKWMETATGAKIARGPEPNLPDMLTAVRGHAAEWLIDANDPKSDKHAFAIKTQPKYGTAAVRDDGRLRVCTNPDVVAMDKLELTITDKNDETRVLTYSIPLAITEGDPADSCDPDDFDSGGCCDSGRSAGGSIPLALGVLAILQKRHRRNAVKGE